METLTPQNETDLLHQISSSRKKVIITRRLQPWQIFDLKHKEELDEQVKLEQILLKGNAEGLQRRKSSKTQFKYIGQPKEKLRNYRSQAVLLNIKQAQQRRDR